MIAPTHLTMESTMRVLKVLGAAIIIALVARFIITQIHTLNAIQRSCL